MDTYGVSSAGVFRIDDLVDLPNDDVFSSAAGEFPPPHAPSNAISFSFESFTDSFPADFASDFCIDDAAGLGRLSHLDDSFANIPSNTLVTARCRSKRSRPVTNSAWWKSLRGPEEEVKSKGKRENRLQVFPAEEGEGVRRCSHCASEKTPQWRTGPLGPKTLCNACGVRYKSGRLVPEYRPAASPSFVPTEHSNSHRKVMELRRQKELLRQLQQH